MMFQSFCKSDHLLGINIFHFELKSLYLYSCPALAEHIRADFEDVSKYQPNDELRKYIFTLN